MQSACEQTRLVFRVGLSLLFLFMAASEIFGSLWIDGPPTPTVNGQWADPDWIHEIFYALLIVIGIWLLFGIRSRVVALAGVLLYSGFTIISHHHGLGLGSRFADLAVVGFLALPLITSGGGFACLYRAGWKKLT